jgi:hypothetical protein
LRVECPTPSVTFFAFDSFTAQCRREAQCPSQRLHPQECRSPPPHITALAPCPRGHCKARARAFQCSRVSRHSPKRAAATPPARAPLAPPRFDSRHPVHGLLHNPRESVSAPGPADATLPTDALHCSWVSVFAPGHAGEELQPQCASIQHLARHAEIPHSVSNPSARPGVYIASDLIQGNAAEKHHTRRHAASRAETEQHPFWLKLYTHAGPAVQRQSPWRDQSLPRVCPPARGGGPTCSGPNNARSGDPHLPLTPCEGISGRLDIRSNAFRLPTPFWLQHSTVLHCRNLAAAIVPEACARLFCSLLHCKGKPIFAGKIFRRTLSEEFEPLVTSRSCLCLHHPVSGKGSARPAQ